MKTAGLIILLSIYAASLFGTQVITGKVSNRFQQALPYANVGFIGTNVGTVSNEHGLFTLSFKADEIESDSLRISVIGYKPFTISFDSLMNVTHLNVQLAEERHEINEVLFVGEKLNRKWIGEFNVSALNMICNFSLNEVAEHNLGAQIGRKFSIPNKPTKLKSFKFYVLHNNYDSVKFSLHIYSLNDGLPSESLINFPIYVDLNKRKTGWVELDLQAYNLVVDENIVLSLEWVSRSDDGTVLALPISMPVPAAHFYKFGSQNNWKRYNAMTTRMELEISY